MILAAPTEQEDDQTNNDGAPVLVNRSTCIPTTGTEGTYIGRWTIH